MVLALVFTFISIAGIYVLLSAEFVAVVQILIYSGAITIIMLFGIMLTKHDDEGVQTRVVGEGKSHFYSESLDLVSSFIWEFIILISHK